MRFPQLSAAGQDQTPSQAQVVIEYGTAEISAEEFKNLRQDSLMVLRESVEEPVRLIVDGQLIGTGIVIIVEGKIAIEITQLTGFASAELEEAKEAASR